MKRKITFLIAVAVMLLTMLGHPLAIFATNASYVFNTTDGLNSLGITIPSNSSGTELGNNTYTVGQITMSSTDGGTATRVWNSSGKYTLRVYTGKSGGANGTLTFAASQGFIITGISVSGSGTLTTSVGSYSNNTWTGMENTVTFTCTSNATITTITVTYVPTHTLTYSATSGGSITSVQYGTTNIASNTQFGEGLTLNIVASASDGYNFNGWTATGTGYSFGNAGAISTTFTMGTTDIALTANFVSVASPNIVISGGGISENALALTKTAHGNQTLSVAFNNMTGYTSPSIALFDDSGCSTPFSGNWFSASLTGTTITYNASANTGTERTVYMQVSATYSASTIYSNVVAITQAELPQLSTPSITAITVGNNKATPTWSAVDNASSYTIDYATNSAFTSGLNTINNITSGTDITGLTNGILYYFRLKAVGDGTNYRTSEWSTTTSATPNNITTITITRSNFATGKNGYGTYDVTGLSIEGKIYAYQDNGTSIQTKNDAPNGANVRNTTAVPGVIKSVTITKASGSDRSWTVRLGNSGLTSSSDGTKLGNSQTVSTNYTWNVVSSDNYCYFLFNVASGATNIGSFEIAYVPKDYHVTYKANGGTGADQVYYFNEDETVTAVANPFTKPTDCTFASWNTAADGSGISYAANATFDMPDENVILYAQWNRTIPDEITTNTTINLGETATKTSLTISSGVLTVNGILNVSGTLTNNGTAANLVIEDGGQLICSNSVAATVKKTITDPTKAEDYGHWYTISSPVHKDGEDHVVISETNLISMAPDYDMFYLDEAQGKWINQKTSGTGFSNMYVGQGYLYRNNGTDLVITGNTNSGDIEYTLTKDGSGDIAGFNLIGNPYPYDINLKHITYNSGSNLIGFYRLSNAGAWGSELGETEPIHSYEGFLVQSDEDDKVATFHETAQRGAKSNGDNIKFMVANSQYEDVAYALFDKGFGLSKINHRNADIPKLYINQEDTDYAIATMSDDTKSFNLNFKAMTTGKYTLSYKADGNFSYLHVIDRLIGEDVDMLLEGEYSFIASPIDSENRFIVRLEYSAGSEISESSIFAYQSGNDIIVNGEGELQIFDMMGRRVLTQYVSGVETINLQLNGVYIFRLNEKTQKIVVK